MKIRLVQFLCYQDSTFDFGNKGITLISGPSGSGKSSIMKGIYFALYGEGTKLQSHGCKSCKVELTFNELTIIRTKGPNRLIVNNIYEDDIGQEIINKQVGHLFKISGYIQQNNISSFILMSPLEKLSFIEKIAFDNVDIPYIKNKNKEYIKECYTKCIQFDTKIETTKQIINQFDIPERVIFPIKCSVKNRHIAIKNEHIRLKNCETFIKRHVHTKTSLYKEYNDLSTYYANITAYTERCNELEQDIINIQNELNNTSYMGDKKLGLYNEVLCYKKNQKPILELEKQVDEQQKQIVIMKNEELHSMKERAVLLSTSIWDTYSEEETKNMIHEYKQCISTLETIQHKQDQISKLYVNEEHVHMICNELETLKYNVELLEYKCKEFEIMKRSYKCPCCLCILHIQDGQLICVKKKATNDISDLSTNVIEKNRERIRTITNEYENMSKKYMYKIRLKQDIDLLKDTFENTPDIQEISEDLKYMEEYYYTNIQNSKEYNKLIESINNQQFSKSYSIFEKKLVQNKQQLNMLIQQQSKYENKHTNDCVYTYDELVNIIRIHTQSQYKRSLLSEKLTNLCSRKKQIECDKQKLIESYLNNYLHIRTIKDVKQHIHKEEECIHTQLNKKAIHTDTIVNIRKWETYNRTIIKYNEWVSKIKDLKKQKQEMSFKHTAAICLKDKISEAESIAITNTIDTINSYAQIYLDVFFSNHPIHVRILPYKHTHKKIKHGIHTQIEYKGMDIDMNMLSGGELTRVILAYTLALSDLFNTPFVMLDECTASLDQDHTEDVFECIREQFNDKIAIIIAHQVVTGTFDNVITL